MLPCSLQVARTAVTACCIRKQDNLDELLHSFSRSENRHKPHTILVRSGLVTAAVLAVVLLVLGLIWRQRGRGNLHRLTAPRVVETAPPVRPGGQDPVTLSRLSLLNSAVPEFLSAELLPGLGMQMLQLTASLPDKGEVPLFASPSLNDLKGTETDLPGAPFVVITDFLPKRAVGNPAIPFSSRPADTVENNTMPDGGAATARFLPTTTDGNGAVRENGIEVSVGALLSGRALDLTMTARNVTEQAHTVSLSWTPHFRAPSGDLRDLVLLVPSSDRLSGNAAKSVHGSADDFSGSSGAPLGQNEVNATFINLKRSFLGNGPVVELRDMRNNFSIRLTALSPSIRSLHVETSPDKKTIVLAYSTADEAVSRAEALGSSQLRPGQQLQWKVRVEIASLTHDHNLRL